ncbi:HAD family hydrolase [Candidatus Odyssella acanthamoebae]|uniref:HAD family hydrolase n=1 Tax=Candidatus Odyssella acanthamoebae TaxID=91604 RepID=UPI00068F6FDA|nr:HAD family hydrolase [Candidatus Paracaedibacter acanthamoebae]
MPYSQHQKPTAVLFDWDNTLVDTMPLICAAINQTLEHFGMKTWSEQDIKQKTQLSAKDGLPHHFGDRWPEALAIYLDFYHQNHLKFLNPLPGALALLNKLTDKNIPMGLVSNKGGATLRREVSHLKWDRFFSALIGAGDAVKDKPDPAPALLALKTMGMEASPAIWFVGDAPVDWRCAEAIGCLPIPIGFCHAEADSYAQAVKNCEDIEKILSKL